MSIQLEIRTGREVAFTFRHPGPRCQIGRNPDAELALTGRIAETVSWDHAVIEVDGGEARVLDLGSTNGTYVNGWRVAGGVEVRPGDEIRLGREGPALRIRAVAAPAKPEPSPEAAPQGSWKQSDTRKFVRRPALEAVAKNCGKLLAALAVALLLLLKRLIDQFEAPPALVDGGLAVLGLIAVCVAMRYGARRPRVPAAAASRPDSPTPFKPAPHPSSHPRIAC
jgi:hypothetical protein